MISDEYLGFWLTCSQSLSKSLLALRGEKKMSSCLSFPTRRKEIGQCFRGLRHHPHSIPASPHFAPSPQPSTPSALWLSAARVSPHCTDSELLPC